MIKVLLGNLCPRNILSCKVRKHRFFYSQYFPLARIDTILKQVNEVFVIFLLF